VRTIIILIAVCVVGILAYKLIHFSELIQQEGNIRVRYEGNLFPNLHKGGKHVLYYGSRQICSDMAAVSPNYYLKSPDSNSILYINETKFDKDLVHSYEIYRILDDRVFQFQAGMHLVGLNGKVEWLESKVLLSDEHQRDILNITEGKMVTETLKGPEGENGRP